MSRVAWIRLPSQILTDAIRKYFSDNGLFLASGLAFDLLLCSIPLSLLIISFLGFALGESDRALADVVAFLRKLLPVPQRVIIKNITAVIEHRGLMGILGFLLFLPFSSIVFGSARLVLNRVFLVPQERSFWLGRWMDTVVMLAAGALLLLAIGTTWLLSFLQHLLDKFAPLGDLVRPVLVFGGDFLGFLFTFLMFYILYKFSPARTISRRALLLGSLTGACLFALAQWAFTLYMEFAKVQVALYGALGGFVFFLFWLYYACTIFILSAEVGWVYDQVMRQDSATPSAEPVG